MAAEASYVTVELRAGEPATKQTHLKDTVIGFGEHRDEDFLFTRLMDVLLTACGEKAEGEAAQRLGKPVKRCLKLLSACGLELVDLELMTAHACAYLDVLVDQYRAASQQVNTLELIYIYCVLLFIAHSHVEDRNVPLRHWHKWAFKNYCELKMLNAAIMETMRKLGYKLRVTQDELQLRLALLRAPDEHRAQLRAALRRVRKTRAALVA